MSPSDINSGVRTARATPAPCADACPLAAPGLDRRANAITSYPTSYDASTGTLTIG